MTPGTPTRSAPDGSRPVRRRLRRISPRSYERLAAAVRGPGWRRTLLLRRAAAGLLAALALTLALVPPEAGRPIVVAARDLPSGTALAAADVAVATWPPALVPTGALQAPEQAGGRILAGAARAGEPLTDVRLAGPESAARLTGRSDAAAVPVRLPDPDVAALLVPGSRVDVVTPGRDDRPVVLAADATVLTVLAAGPDSTGRAPPGRLVLVALARADAARVAAASLSEQVAVTLR